MLEKGKEEWAGQMAHFMKANGKMEWEMELDNITCIKDSFIKVNGCKIWSMDKDIWEIIMVIKYLELGNMINWMAKQELKWKIQVYSKM